MFYLFKICSFSSGLSCYCPAACSCCCSPSQRSPSCRSRWSPAGCSCCWMDGKLWVAVIVKSCVDKQASSWLAAHKSKQPIRSQVSMLTTQLLTMTTTHKFPPQSGGSDCAHAAHYFDVIRKKLAAMVKSVKGVEKEAGSLDYSLGCLSGCEGDFMCSMDCGLH